MESGTLAGSLIPVLGGSDHKMGGSMNRRDFSRTLGIGVLGVGVGAAGGGGLRARAQTHSAAPAIHTRPRSAESESKQWAREHLHGPGSLLAASYLPDLRTLDEDGVRHDVRHRIEQGFCETMVWAAGDHRGRVIEIFQEESQGRLLRSQMLGGSSAETAIANLETAAREGCTHVTMSYPGSLRPETEAEVYAYYREVADASPIPLLVYGRGVESLRRFHPSGIAINVLDRLADHPKVVGMKMTHAMPAGLAFELAERLADRMILGPVNQDHVPILGKHYPDIQWTGQWITDAIQSPEKPYGVELLDLVSKGRMEDAMKVYWRMLPLIELVYEVQGRLLQRDEEHPHQHMKYYQWLMGANGGLLPSDHGDNIPVLDAAWRRRMRDTCRQAGIVVDRPDEEFMVGRAAYARGVRASDLSSTPNYEA